jgi:hypothetical protein
MARSGCLRARRLAYLARIARLVALPQSREIRRADATATCVPLNRGRRRLPRRRAGRHQRCVLTPGLHREVRSTPFLRHYEPWRRAAEAKCGAELAGGFAQDRFEKLATSKRSLLDPLNRRRGGRLQADSVPGGVRTRGPFRRGHGTILRRPSAMRNAPRASAYALSVRRSAVDRYDRRGGAHTPDFSARSTADTCSTPRSRRAS